MAPAVVDFEWTEERLRQIVDRARESRQRAESMRAQCQRIQRTMGTQQERLRELAGRLARGGTLQPPGDSTPD